ncbi:Hypothetical predicted protein, partial [Pelobates cultripes]
MAATQESMQTRKGLVDQEWKVQFEAKFEAICQEYWHRIANRVTLQPPLDAHLTSNADSATQSNSRLGAKLRIALDHRPSTCEVLQIRTLWHYDPATWHQRIAQNQFHESRQLQKITQIQTAAPSLAPQETGQQENPHNSDGHPQ